MEVERNDFKKMSIEFEWLGYGPFAGYTFNKTE
jgi:hypothetical protein